jgi:FtsZ-binding cell division protein ZapB
MTQNEKAEKFERLTKEGDVIQRDISKLQSENAGVNTKSKEYDDRLQRLRGRLSFLELEMRKLFM